MARMGRPPLPDSVRRDKFRVIRLTSAELRTLQRAAKAAGRPLSVYIREAALRGAERGQEA